MVREVEPNYYAEGRLRRNFTVRGEYLDIIPSNAIGILSTDNNNPLQHRDSVSDVIVIPLANQTERSLEFEQELEHTLTQSSYLGAILSNDRQEVYWVNESRPLP